MATTAQIYSRWLSFNLNGQGKETGSVSSHRYDRSVYYYNEVPYQRFIHRDGQPPVILMINTIMTMPPVFKGKVQTIMVEDISVFSKYPDDMLDIAKTHERSRYVMLNAMLHFVDVEVPSYSDEDCHAKTTLLARCLDRLDKLFNRYQDYSMAFGLRWPAPPQTLHGRLKDTVTTKAAKWSDPKSTEKRERARARRLADKALGLNG